MTDIMRQLFDKRLCWVWLGLAITHGVSALVLHTSFAWIPLLVFTLGATIISYRRLEFGLALAFVEIFVGGHGHLLDTSLMGMSLSLRMVIFVGVMLGWLLGILTRRYHLRLVPTRDLPWALLLLAVSIGWIIGFTNNPRHDAFDDANSYATILYLLPIVSIIWTAERKRVLLLAFSASAVWMAVTTLLLLFAFTHLEAEGIWTLYRFVRDVRLAEVTLLSSPAWIVDLLQGGDWYFRVFEQSQFTILAFELLLIAYTWLGSREGKTPLTIWGLHALMVAALLAGASRSFFMGFAGGLGVIGLAILFSRSSWSSVLRRKLLGLGSIALALGALWAIISLPLPPRPDLSNSPFYHGEDDDTRDLAVSSRWNLLGPLNLEIAEAPVMGQGFGKSVTFISDDPRVRAINSTGEWTTYRFEWGYQDIWLKMGVLGLATFMIYLGTLASATLRSWRTGDDSRWLALGLFSGLVALFITHAFSPYLNHPLGLGFMLFVLPFFSWEIVKKEIATEPRVQQISTAIIPTPAMRKMGVK